MECHLLLSKPDTYDSSVPRSDAKDEVACQQKQGVQQQPRRRGLQQQQEAEPQRVQRDLGGHGGRHGCQMDIAKFLDCMHLALRA